MKEFMKLTTFSCSLLLVVATACAQTRTGTITPRPDNSNQGKTRYEQTHPGQTSPEPSKPAQPDQDPKHSDQQKPNHYDEPGYSSNHPAQPNHGHSGSGHPGYYGSAHYGATVEQIAIIKDYVRSISFDSDRLKALKMIVKICPLDAETIGELTEFFSFDDRRLELLKTAYPYCIDPMHYQRAINHLSFYSNKEEMYKWIDQH